MSIITTETTTSTIDELEGILASLDHRDKQAHWIEQAAAHLRNYREHQDTGMQRLVADAYEAGFVAGQGLKG